MEYIILQLANSLQRKFLYRILILVLILLDQHDQWIPERQTATIHTFNAIMYSIQLDLSYILIERILVHLDRVTSVTAKGKCRRNKAIDLT